MSQTMLEMAANVRQTKSELDDACSRLRSLGGDWTEHSLAGEEALKIADDGLRNCWAVMQRLKRLAEQEVARLQAAAPEAP
jgi:hypothetical protein